MKISEQLELFVLAAAAQNPEAWLHAKKNIKAEHFKWKGNAELYSAIITDELPAEEIDTRVIAKKLTEAGHFRTETDALGTMGLYTPGEPWKPAMDEFKRHANKERIKDDLYELYQSEDDPKQLATATIAKATSWIHGEGRTWRTGAQVEEESKTEAERILTGVPLYDNHLFNDTGDRRGQMKCYILREKHGKTREACWEAAHDLLYGHQVHYVTMEGTASDITGNIKEILRDHWDILKDRLFVTDQTTDTDQILADVTETVLTQGVAKVYFDYAQLMIPPGRWQTENERINTAVEQVRAHMVKFKYNAVMLSQARKIDAKAKGGYKETPTITDSYGSMALIKASSIILVGFRPYNFDHYKVQTPLGLKIQDPDGDHKPKYSVFFKTVLSRKKPRYLHAWYWYQDTDEGYKLQGWLHE